MHIMFSMMATFFSTSCISSLSRYKQGMFGINTQQRYIFIICIYLNFMSENLRYITLKFGPRAIANLTKITPIIKKRKRKLEQVSHNSLQCVKSRYRQKTHMTKNPTWQKSHMTKIPHDKNPTWQKFHWQKPPPTKTAMTKSPRFVSDKNSDKKLASVVLWHYLRTFDLTFRSSPIWPTWECGLRSTSNRS